MTSNDNDGAEPNHWPWEALMREFWLTDARIIATLGPERGALMEITPRLLCSEGRMWTLENRGDLEGRAEQLEYGFVFACHEEAEPLPSEAVEGRIVITGTHPNGLNLEIRGDGWIGYDELGRVEGRFDQPPFIILEGDGVDKGEPTRHGYIELPEHFQRACLKVPLIAQDEPGPHLVRGR